MAYFGLYLLMEVFLICNVLNAQKINNSNVLEKPKNGGNYTKILSSILKDYEKNIRPDFGGEQITVGVKLSILSVISVNEVELDWTSTLGLKQTWNDSRLQFDPNLGVRSIIYPNKDPEMYWVPDLHFLDEKPDVGVYSTPKFNLKLYPEGKLEMIKSMTVKSKCDIPFRYYPFGFFSCTMRLKSFSYPSEDLILKWKDGVNDSVLLYKLESYHQFSYAGILIFDEDTSNSLKFTVYFRRSVGHYILQWFVPCATVVLLSFLTFYLDRSAIGERLALGMTSVLTISFIWNNVEDELPQVNYLKSIDTFLGFSFGLCCFSLMVNTVIGFLQGMKTRNTETARSSRFTRWIMKMNIERSIPAVLNSCARICFPVVFLGFCMFYFALYMPNIDNEVAELKKQRNFSPNE